jgi:hypothetical protein
MLHNVIKLGRLESMTLGTGAYRSPRDIYHPKRPDYSPWAPGSKAICVDKNGRDVT